MDFKLQSFRQCVDPFEYDFLGGVGMEDVL